MPLSDTTVRRLLDAAPDAFLVVDREGVLVYANRAVREVFGYAPEELVGAQLETLLPEGSSALHAKQRTDYFEDPRILHPERAGIRGRRKDGSEFPAAVSVAPVQTSDGRDCAFASIRDISEHRRMERERERQRALHDALFRKAPLGIAIVDVSGRVVEANPTLESLLGYTADELVGMHFADFTHPDDLDADLDQYERLVAGEIDSYALEKRYLRKDGEVICGSLRVVVLERRDDAPRYVVGMVEDVTEQKSLQEQLLLSQRLEAVGQLAGGIAHDFNNYLTAISGYTQLTMMALPEGHEASADLLEVLKAAESCATLTRQILAFSRRQVLDRRHLALNDLLRETHRMLGRLLGEDVTVELELAEELWPVSADPAQLEQVLVNLAVNARDAMPRGGTLAMRTANAQVDRLAAAQRPGMRPGEYALLTVSDTGSGMPPEVRDRAFEPFFTTKEPGRGTGLGLSTVYGIVKQHGGNVWVSSVPGAGTTFRIYLPRLLAGETGEKIRTMELTEPHAGSGCVLVVEDDENVRDLVARSLESCGYEVLTASDAADALALLEGDEPELDLLLTDVVMPKISGLELADRLREIRPGLKTLFMSGHSAEALARYRPEGTPFRWIHKPFTLGQLARRVQEAISDAD